MAQRCAVHGDGRLLSVAHLLCTLRVLRTRVACQLDALAMSAARLACALGWPRPPAEASRPVCDPRKAVRAPARACLAMSSLQIGFGVVICAGTQQGGGDSYRPGRDQSWQFHQRHDIGDTKALVVFY